MKIVFAGTPDFAVAPLQNIIDNGFEVVGVITQTDKPQGRKGILTPPPVKTLAQKYNIPVLQPEKILLDAFGLVAMVAMTPLITIQVLGFRAVAARHIKEKIAMKRILSADDEQIIQFM